MYLSGVVLLLLTAAAASALPSVDPLLVQKLETDGSADVFLFARPIETSEYVQLRQSWEHGLQQGMSRTQRRTGVYAMRTALADASQAGMRKWLQGQAGVTFQTFWLSNVILVRNASKALVEAAQMRSDVIAIRPNRVHAHIDLGRDKFGQPSTNAIEWNLLKIKVPEAWNITKGAGVVVANIDTGVRWTHEALRESYRGLQSDGTVNHDYNWFDPKEFARDPYWCDFGCSPRECCLDEPFDNTGHGTHTMGTIAGAEKFGFGIAPAVKWIAAKGCRDGSCLDSGLLASGEWVLCPTRLNGLDPDCSKGADIVSNSWGSSSSDDFFQEWTAAWLDAGILPVFSQGNGGPRCSTAGSPGDFANVLGVGATDVDDRLADFSSRGPGPQDSAIFSRAKPDLTAPGEDILSSSSTLGSSDNAKYLVKSGTSMAAPHVSAVAALILSVNRNLRAQDVMQLIVETTDQVTQPPKNGLIGNDVCSSVRYDAYPHNFHYGHGRLNAYNAVQAALKKKQTNL